MLLDNNLIKGGDINNAIVVTEDPGQMLYTTVSDANCCVELGRLSVFDFSIGGGEVALLGHYSLYPWAEAVTDEECAHIEALLMSTQLAKRKACLDNFSL